MNVSNICQNKKETVLTLPKYLYLSTLTIYEIDLLPLTFLWLASPRLISILLMITGCYSLIVQTSTIALTLHVE